LFNKEILFDIAIPVFKKCVEKIGGEKKKPGILDSIRCDEPSYLIWKWRPEDKSAKASGRENSIRWGSSLRVKEGEVAVFVCSMPTGSKTEFIKGPFNQILETANLPVIADFIGEGYSGGTPFPAEVYFINMAKLIQVKFGVPYFDVFDPRFADLSVPVAVRGTVSFRITNYKEFVKLHRLIDFSLDDFQLQIRDAVRRSVKDIVANAPAAHNIPVVQIESKIAQINDAVEYDIRERLKETFGVTVTAVDIGAIEIDKASEGYRKLMKSTREI